MSRHKLAVMLGLVLVALPVAAAPLTILYTNDLHLRFERLDSLERIIAEQRQNAGALLLLDAGDTWQDFRQPIAAVWGADEMVEWMNRAGYDAMALGNHDFYWGAERLAQLAAHVRFALLCSSLRPIPGSRAPFVPAATFDAGGLSVYVVGLTTSEYHAFSAMPWLQYIPPVEVLETELARRPEGADLTVVLAHVPVADAVGIARRVPGIDIFITGHSHEETIEPIVVGETVIVQSGRFGQKLGRLDLEIDADGNHRVVAHRLIPTEKAPAELGRGLRQLARVLAALSLSVLLVVSSFR